MRFIKNILLITSLLLPINNIYDEKNEQYFDTFQYDNTYDYNIFLNLDSFSYYEKYIALQFVIKNDLNESLNIEAFFSINNESTIIDDRTDETYYKKSLIEKNDFSVLLFNVYYGYFTNNNCEVKLKINHFNEENIYFFNVSRKSFLINNTSEKLYYLSILNNQECKSYYYILSSNEDNYIYLLYYTYLDISKYRIHIDGISIPLIKEADVLIEDRNAIINGVKNISINSKRYFYLNTNFKQEVNNITFSIDDIFINPENFMFSYLKIGKYTEKVHYFYFPNDHYEDFKDSSLVLYLNNFLSTFNVSFIYKITIENAEREKEKKISLYNNKVIDDDKMELIKL